MRDEKYQKLAKVLDTLPNGFPATESGTEIKLLKKIFRPEDVDLFCDLRLDFETAEQISERTGRPLEGLEEHLDEMRQRGQIFQIDFGGVKVYKMIPWVFGIYEFQLAHIDKEMAELWEEYKSTFMASFVKTKPHLMQIVPVEKRIESKQEALPYERVSNIIENSQSFAVFDCICKKQKGLLGKACDKPIEVCTAYAPVPGIFDNVEHFRPITKSEAYAVLDLAENAGLVHMTSNVEGGHFFICNCCGCCCPNLEAITKLGALASDVVNSSYYAEINSDNCSACGICKDERCQVNAIEERKGGYEVVSGKCIGCGLCVSTCPSEAIILKRKKPENIYQPPKDDMDWYVRRASERGIDISKYI